MNNKDFFIFNIRIEHFCSHWSVHFDTNNYSIHRTACFSIYSARNIYKWSFHHIYRPNNRCYPKLFLDFTQMLHKILSFQTMLLPVNRRCPTKQIIHYNYLRNLRFFVDNILNKISISCDDYREHFLLHILVFNSIQMLHIHQAQAPDHGPWRINPRNLSLCRKHLHSFHQETLERNFFYGLFNRRSCHFCAN